MDPCALSLLSTDVQKFFPPDVPFVRYGTHGDGTCFFHSVCAALNEQDYLSATQAEQKRIGRKYRCEFTKHITDEAWAAFAPLNDDGTLLTAEMARRNFCNSRHWANQPMITFVSKILKLNLLFIDTTKSKLYCGVHGKDTEPMIVILWVNGSHFEPIGACRKIEKERTCVQFKFDPTKDAAIVDFVVNKYKGQCGQIN